MPRILPDGLAVRLEPARWAMPSAMRFLGALGGSTRRNPGYLQPRARDGAGSTAGAEEVALAAAAEQGMAGLVVGDVVPIAETGGRRYVEVR